MDQPGLQKDDFTQTGAERTLVVKARLLSKIGLKSIWVIPIPQKRKR